MPSGYTCGVQDGTITNLKDYMFSCARGFGALMHMRDDNIGSEIKYREIDNYYSRKLNETKEEYDRFLSLTDEEIQAEIDSNYEKNLNNKKEGLIKFNQGKQRYLDMIEKVKGWDAPTEEHENLKKFALEQLENSLDFDYSDETKTYYETIPPKATVSEYKIWKIGDCLKDIEYYSKNYRAEIERVKEANEWIKNLVESFE